jgi:hypothetical protein
MRTGALALRPRDEAGPPARPTARRAADSVGEDLLQAPRDASRRFLRDPAGRRFCHAVRTEAPSKTRGRTRHRPWRRPPTRPSPESRDHVARPGPQARGLRRRHGTRDPTGRTPPGRDGHAPAPGRRLGRPRPARGPCRGAIGPEELTEPVPPGGSPPPSSNPWAPPPSSAPVGGNRGHCPAARRYRMRRPRRTT